MNEFSNFPAIAVMVFVAACLAFDLRRGIHRLLSGRSVVLAAVAYWFLLEAVRIPNELKRYSAGEYNFGLFCVALSVVIFLIAYHRSSLALFAPLSRRLVILNDSRVVWRIFVAGMLVGYGSLLIYADFNVLGFFEGLSGMTARWEGVIVREKYGSWRTLLYEMQMFLQAVTPLAVCLIFMRRVPFGQKLAATLFLTWMFLRALFSGARSPLLPLLVCAGAAVVWRASPRLRRALLVVGLPLALIGGNFLAAVIVAGRNEGKFDTDAGMEVEYVGYEMFRELLFVIRSEQSGVLSPQLGSTYFTQLVNPIPRALWPGKPRDAAGAIIARAYGAVDRQNEVTVTVGPGFVGEAYLNLGFLGVLVLPAVAGVLVRAWDLLSVPASTSLPTFLVYTAGLAAIFGNGRCFNLSLFYGLLALWLLLVVFERLGLTPPRKAVPIRSFQHLNVREARYERVARQQLASEAGPALHGAKRVAESLKTVPRATRDFS